MAEGGILEDGIVAVSDKGTGQGAVISPLPGPTSKNTKCLRPRSLGRTLARREPTGDMIIVRYAMTIIVGFEHEADARRFWMPCVERLGEFALTLQQSGANPPDRVRPPMAARTASGAGWQAVDLHLPGLHV